jgi:hypothetical protein
MIAAFIVIWPLILGQNKGGGYHLWTWFVAVPWWIILALVAIGYVASKNDKAKPRQSRRSARKIPPSDRELENSKMSHDKAYTDLIAQLLVDLSMVGTTESAGMFTDQALQRIRAQAVQAPEFYIGEFLNRFKNAVVRQSESGIAACEQARNEATAEAGSVSVELQARLYAATAAGDRDAEHAVWRDREAKQATVQAGIDDSVKRVRAISLRLDTCKNLASALGFPYR